MLKTHFTQIPHIYHDLDLDPYERCLLYHVLRRGNCYESQRALAKSTKMSLGKVNKSINSLLEMGLIEYRSNGKTRKQWLVAVDMWQANHDKYCQGCDSCKPNAKEVPKSLPEKRSHSEQRSPHEHNEREQCSSGEQRSSIREQCSSGERPLKKTLIKNNLKEEEKREERARAQDDQIFEDDYFDQEESEAQKFQREQKELKLAIERVTGSHNPNKTQSVALNLHRIGILAFHVIDIYGTDSHRREIGLKGDGYWYTDSRENRSGGMPYLGNIENISRELQQRERGITKNKVPAQTTKQMPAQQKTRYHHQTLEEKFKLIDEVLPQ